MAVGLMVDDGFGVNVGDDCCFVNSNGELILVFVSIMVG